ncbi:uncharacterized protein LOC116805431 [Drosophila grimshawi]|uniref:uncharacterized protein LOC116805431 n=1 Tax=Drosophila grimshawi TaxID=7222 RepID=UPI000C86ECCF|nr:uncharacterized protein LOC116805431 [Drosophila grimshawi]
MPCFKRERSISHCPRKDKQNNREVPLKPVHPRSLRYHGLFGVSFAPQHMVIDERWAPNSLTEQFGGMTDLLTRNLIFKRYDTKANRLNYVKESKKLKLQCRDGRAKLQNILTDDNTHRIRNFLINHKDMQRLYQRMPIHLVADNINQRTFTMRKERDRLECRLGQLKHQYRKMLIDRAELENRIRYQNEFVLEEEIKSRDFIKKIENSNVRLKAIKAINSTYQKMIEVLRHDAIFYEPILRSLAADMEDQANFIKHILYLGMPAISKFKELNDQYRHLENKSSKYHLIKEQLLASFKNTKKAGSFGAKPREGNPASANPKRYLRETTSMLILKNVFQTLEKRINEVKCGTLCLQAKEIYPRLEFQMDNKEKMIRLTEHDKMTREYLEEKIKYATLLEGILVNNLSEEEINRLERIEDLKRILKGDEELEQKTLEYIKNRADAFVLIRIRLWNLIEILRHIDRDPKMFRSQYPNSYLKLPLLKFEMHHMYASPPELCEEDTEKIMSFIKRKVYKLMKGYNATSDIDNSKEKYHIEFLKTVKCNPHIRSAEGRGATVGEDLLQMQKTLANVPDRTQIKAQSNRIVDDAILRRDEA